jgi:hypothetical protein
MNERMLKRVRETPRKVMKYKEANWDKIKKDLENTLTTINKRESA